MFVGVVIPGHSLVFMKKGSLITGCNVRSIDSRFLARIEYFSNLLHSIFDNSFKFIDVIEVFTTYDKFNSADLRLNNSKKAIKNIISTKK